MMLFGIESKGQSDSISTWEANQRSVLNEEKTNERINNKEFKSFLNVFYCLKFPYNKSKLLFTSTLPFDQSDEGGRSFLLTDNFVFFLKITQKKSCIIFIMILTKD